MYLSGKRNPSMAQSKMIYGFHAVMAALTQASENVLALYCQEDRDRLKPLIEKAKASDLTVQFTSRVKLEAMVHSPDHQGVVAQVKGKRALDEHALWKWLEEEKNREKPPLLLILEGIQDPHNVGACLRSAAAFGVDWVILSKSQSAPLNATVAKTASGADQTLSIVSVSNIVRVIEELQKRGVWIIGTSLEATVSLSQVDLTRAIALVMGSEDKGLKSLTATRCDELAKIPLSDTMASLNVSVATGICLYECQRQR